MQPRVLTRDTFKFNDSSRNTYKYEVELVVLNDLIGKNSVVNSKEFKIFAIKESIKKENKIHNLDSNIRDLYSIDIHIKGKNKEDLSMFEKLNDIILSYDKRLNK